MMHVCTIGRILLSVVRSLYSLKCQLADILSSHSHYLQSIYNNLVVADARIKTVSDVPPVEYQILLWFELRCFGLCSDNIRYCASKWGRCYWNWLFLKHLLDIHLDTIWCVGSASYLNLNYKPELTKYET